MSDYQYDFAFDIMDVAKLVDIRIKRKAGGSVYADCPFCDDTRGKLNLNLTKNVFRCNRCGEYGGALALYAKLHGISNHAANREICDILFGNGTKQDFLLKKEKELKPHIPNNSNLASLYDRNQTYEMLLSMLILSSKHREMLAERGLSDEDITRFEFRSTPAFGFDKIVKSLVDSGCVIEGVPGFYMKSNSDWTMNFASYCAGIMIPIRTMAGMIQGFQIRLDKPYVDEKGKETKYIWFSSVSHEKGVSSGGPAHFVGDPAATTVYVTEGALKADVAHSLSGKTFLAVPGAGIINCLKEPFEILKQNGTETIYECLDQDKYVNEYVMNGSKNLIKLANEFGFKCKILRWDKKYKGVDDFLKAKSI